MKIDANYILNLRKKLSLTQEGLASILGVSRRSIQNWEGGAIIPKTKHEILRTLLEKGTDNVESKISHRLPLIDDIRQSELDISVNKSLKFLKLGHFERIALIPHVTIPLYGFYLDNIKKDSFSESLPKFPFLRSLHTSKFSWNANNYAFTVYDESLNTSDQYSIKKGDTIIATALQFPFIEYDSDIKYVVVLKNEVLFGNIESLSNSSEEWTISPDGMKIKYNNIKLSPLNKEDYNERIINEQDIQVVLKIAHSIREVDF